MNSLIKVRLEIRKSGGGVMEARRQAPGVATDGSVIILEWHTCLTKIKYLECR